MRLRVYYLVLLGEDGNHNEKVAEHGEHRDTGHHVYLDILHYPNVGECILVILALNPIRTGFFFALY